MPKNCPLITVIVPIYNVEKYLSFCLESIINQTYRNLEIILIDDGSPDNCGEICDNYASHDSRIKVIHKINGGVSSARNAGLNIATGEWLYFIDPDDWIDLDTLELVLNQATQTGTDLCFFDTEQVFKGTTAYCPAIKSKESIFLNLTDIDTLCMYMYQTGNCNFIVRSACVLKKIFYNESLSISEDTIFKFILYKQINGFSHLKRPLYHYRMRENSCMGTITLNLVKLVYQRFNILNTLIQAGGYPQNSEIIPNTIELLRELPTIIDMVFDKKIDKKTRNMILNEYINTDEFKQARLNYDKRMLNRSAKFYLKFNYLNNLTIIAIYLLRKLKKLINKENRF